MATLDHIARGQIKHRALSRRIKDFTGLRYGAITPTDIDGFIDFGGRAFVLFEFKYPGTDELPYGQRLALERAVDAWEAAGKPSLLIVAWHDMQGDIDAANCMVYQTYFRDDWKSDCHRTVKQVTDEFYRLYVQPSPN